MKKKLVLSILSFFCSTAVAVEQDATQVSMGTECEQVLDDSILASKRIATDTLDLLQTLYQGRIPGALKKMIDSVNGDTFLHRMYVVRNLANVAADLSELRKFFDEMTLLCEFVMVMDPQFATTDVAIDLYFERFAEFLGIDMLNLDETAPAVQFYLQSKRDAAAKAALHALVDQLNQECVILRDKLFSCTVEFDKKNQLCSRDNGLLKEIITNLNSSLDAIRVELREKLDVNNVLVSAVKTLMLELDDLKKIIAEREAGIVSEQKKLSKVEEDRSCERDVVFAIKNNLKKTQSLLVGLRKTSNRKSQVIKQLSDKLQSVTKFKNVSLACNLGAVLAFAYSQLYK